MAYLAGTARSLGCDCFRVGGVQDHVHLAFRLAATRISAKVVSELKTSSSVWMKERGVARFAWQRGYGLFSVGPADVGALVRYIDGQKAHHASGVSRRRCAGFARSIMCRSMSGMRGIEVALSGLQPWVGLLLVT